jgi:hypothetical protein
MLTQNNNTNSGIYPPQLNAGAGQVHIDLMGDPSLRMHIVKPPASVSASATDSGVTLNWGASADTAVLGYYAYKASSAEGPFVRISGSDPLASTSFNDPTGNANAFYMVRALKLEQTPNGAYYNLSQGVFYPDPLASSGVPETPREISIARISRGSIDISWIANPMNVRAFEVQRRSLPNGAFSKIGEVPNTASTFTDVNLSAGLYAYRVKALGFAGDSDFSGEASINFNSSWGSIAGNDTESHGNWIGKYGAEGYIVVGAKTNIPPSINFAAENTYYFAASYGSDDEPETLFYPDGQHRLNAAWFNNHRAPMVYSFRFNDSKPHRITFYMLDNSGARSGTISVVDPYSGAEFGSVYFNHYEAGEYVSVDVRNYADILISSEFLNQFAVPVNGIFFDAAPEISSLSQFSFAGIDTTTQGDWKSKYGNQGQLIADFTSNLPPGVTLTQPNNLWTWETRTYDKRAVNKYSDDATRMASTWYSTGQCAFDLNINTTQPKQVALYMLDWDNAGRVEDLTITDSTGATLLSRRISNFSGGQYLVFNAKGQIHVSAKLVNGPNAVINAIFFGTAPIVISSDPVNLSYNVANGSYTIRISGQPGQVFDIESSADCRGWTKISQQTLSGNLLDIPMPFDTGASVRFFRAVLAQ